MEEKIYEIADLVEKAEGVSEGSKDSFIDVWDEVVNKVEQLDDNEAEQLVELLKQDYSDNWVADEVIELVTER